jgi:hypothetical protein
LFIFTKIKFRRLRKFIKIMGQITVSLLALILLAWLLIQTDLVQNIVIKKVTKRLSKDLHTEVSIRHISLALFNSMNLEGTLIKDQHKDTLLFADNLRLRITDWFFVKDELVLKYVGLEDAYINTYRRDSIWNYAFLVDYFSPTTPKTEKKQSNLKFNLKRLDFKNIRLVQNDMWAGERMDVSLGNLQLDADSVNLDENKIKINTLDLEKPFFSIKNFEGLRPVVAKPKKAVADTGMYFNEGDLQLIAGRVTIRNGTFNIENETGQPVYPNFDPDHIRFDKINGTFTNVSFIKDTIKANVNLSTKERSGFDIRKLKADFRFTPQIMEFAKLDLITKESHLQNYYAMRYKDFNKDFADYVSKVTMEARFTNSELNSDDLAYFAPETKTWKRRISFSGNARGTVDNISAKNLFVRAGNTTTLSGDLTMVGLPDINTTQINFTSGNIQTTYKDAVVFVPAIKDVEIPSLASLGNVKFNGNFRGTISKFATDGNLSTNLGAVNANVVMELPDKGSPSYNGRIITSQFNIGKFLVIKDMGNVAFDGTVKGVGLNVNTLRTSVTGTIGQLTYKDYVYKRINVEGTFQRKQFEGSVKVDDPNIDIVTTVKMDFRGAQPQFNVLGDLAHSNFQNLNLIDRRLEFSGVVDLNFSGKNIDQFLGAFKIFNANLLLDSVRVDLDSLTLESRFENGRRLLALRSNEFDASIEGIYNILDLPTSFQVFLHKYYPSYINEPRRTSKNQKFTFALNTKNIEGYTHLIDKDLSGFSNSTITGTINTIDTIFEVKADVPLFSYNQYKFNNIAFTGKGNLDALRLTGNIDDIRVADSANFPNTRIGIVSTGDHSQVSISTKANNTLNELNLNAELTTLTDGVKIKFNPSDFVINDKRWALEKEGEIVIRKRFVSADNVRFTQGFQVIEVQTTYDTEFDKSNLLVRLQNINIGDFSPFITTDPRLEGIASGNVIMRDFYGKFNIEANLKAEQFRVDNDSVGIVLVKGNYNSTNGKIGFNVQSDNELYNFLANGSYDLRDTLGTPLLTSIELNNTKINIVNKFLGSIFTNIDGLATGELHINGNPGKPDLLGRVKLRNGALTVNFTKVRYNIDSANFNFAPGVIDFGRFIIKDKFGNTGIASGKLYEKGFQNLRFDFDINTKRLLLIDTKANDNPQFYGTAIAKAAVTLTGPEENMHLTIAAEPVDSSSIYIPTTNTRETGETNFIVFKQYGTEMKEVTANESSTDIAVDLDLTANPLAKVHVILDQVTGDIIKANGYGRLKIHAGTSDPLTINGRYEISKGSYDFNFQSFIKKPFILKEDAGNFIEWNGDPFNARLNIEALYVAENVRLNDLVSNQNIGGVVQGYKGDVYVVASITDNLQKPNIKFRLDFPAHSEVKNNETFIQFLNKIQQDDNEMLKQVTYLIVFGSFAPYGEGRNIATNVTTLGVNTISEVISKQVNSLVSNLLYRITGDRSLQFDVSTSVYNSSSLFSGNVIATNNIDRQQVNFKLGKSLFNNKVIVTFGGDLDFRMGSNSVSSTKLGNVQWLPDLTVEIILSKDKKVRAIVFSRNDLDISTTAVGRRNRQGASISYRSDFDNLFAPKGEKKNDNGSIIFKSPASLTKEEPE